MKRNYVPSQRQMIADLVEEQRLRMVRATSDRAYLIEAAKLAILVDQLLDTLKRSMLIADHGGQILAKIDALKTVCMKCSRPLVWNAEKSLYVSFDGSAEQYCNMDPVLGSELHQPSLGLVTG